MIKILKMTITEKEYINAKKVIEQYELQQNNSIIDYYYNDYRTLEEASSIMKDMRSPTNKTIYCYQKSNKRYAISLLEIIGAIPISVLTYSIMT